jgi:hypothetical protein
MRFRTPGVLFALTLALPGCFSSSSSAGNPAPEDSGETESDASDAATPMDAATVVTADASQAEAAAPLEAAAPIEAAAPEAEAGVQAVIVTIVNHAGPEPGVLIVFQDAAGNVVTTGTTDATGRVIQVVQPGSQVTAVMGSGPTNMVAPIVVGGGSGGVQSVHITVDDQPIPVPQNVQLVTVQGVKPGDVLSLLDPSDSTFASAQVTIDSLPDAAAPAETYVYEAQIGDCYNYFYAPPITLGLTSDCESNGTFPVLVQALDNTYSNITGYTYVTGNSLAVDGGATHVAISAPWQPSPETSANIEIWNVPATNLNNVQGNYSQVADGVASAHVSSTSSADGGAELSFPVFPGYGTFGQSEVDLTQDNQFQQISAVATRTADGGPATIDLSTALPYITTVTLDAGNGDPDASVAAPSVAWGSDAGSLASVNGVVVQLGWYEGETSFSGTWTVLTPPTSTSVTMPTLPPSVAGWGPNSNSSFDNPPVVVAVQASFIASYDQLRSQFAAIPATNALTTGETYNGGSIPPLPVPGTVRLSAFTYNGD